jgi:hypothetical protein
MSEILSIPILPLLKIAKFLPQILITTIIEKFLIAFNKNLWKILTLFFQAKIYYLTHKILKSKKIHWSKEILFFNFVTTIA